MSQVQTIAGFYILAPFLGLGFAACSAVPCSMMITNWFEEKRGLAMGIIFAGSNVGGALYSQLASRVIIASGWRSAYLACGIAMAVTMLPCALLIARRSPADKGLLPYGAVEEKLDSSRADAGRIEHGVTMSKAIKLPVFWLLAVATFLTSTLSLGVSTQYVAHLSDAGFSAAAAGNIATAFMLTTMVAKILSGSVFDKVGMKAGYCGALLCFIVGTIILIYLQPGSLFMLVIFLVFFAAGNTVTTVPGSFITAEVFGRKDYGAIFGFMQLCTSAGLAIGPTLSASIFDALGQYTSVFWLWCAVTVVTIAIAMLCLNMSKNVREKYWD